jgi:hypothetical protein
MVIVIFSKSNNDAFELILVEDEKVIQALPFHCADQSLAKGI